MEDMDVDLTFSDVTNYDISMREVNRLLNTTEVIENKSEECPNLNSSFEKASPLNLTHHIGDGDSNLNLSDNQLDNVTHEVLDNVISSDEETKEPFYEPPIAFNTNNVSVNNLINFSMDSSQFGGYNIGSEERQENADLLDATFKRISSTSTKKQLDPFDVTYVLKDSPRKSDENNSKHENEVVDNEEGAGRTPTAILINFNESMAATTIAEATDDNRAASTSDQLETPEEAKETTMDGDLDKSQLVQELNRLKLELNQVKQEDTTLMLQLQKKEETYLKAEADFQQKESQYTAQIAEYQEKLANIQKHNNNEEKIHDEVKQLEEGNAKLQKIAEEITHYKKIVNEYETTLRTKNNETEKLKQENITVNKHLAVLEAAFSDVISKYDRSKELIMGFTRNETILKEHLEKSKQTAITYEKRYETLKAHANSQLEKASKDTFALKEQHQHEITKLKSIIKHHTIKIASLEQTIEQKVSECKALATLWEEMTGSAPQ